MKNFQLSSKHLVIAVVFLLSGLSFAFKAGSSPSQITICHTPPGNPGNCQEITVSINALEAHLNHGDNLICHNANELEAYTKIVDQHKIKVSYSTNIVVIGF